MEDKFDFEQAFKEQAQRKYLPFAESLAAYRDALLDKGFTREESISLVQVHAKFIYDMAIEEALNEEDDDLPNDSNDEEDLDTP